MNNRYNAFRELMLFRFRAFYREPAAMFWSYGFPVILTVSLGIAFRSKPPQPVFVQIADGPEAKAVQRSILKHDSSDLLHVSIAAETNALHALAVSECAVVVRIPQAAGEQDTGGGEGENAKPNQPDTYNYEYVFDPTRPDSTMARRMVDAALQRAAGRRDAITAKQTEVTEPGSRYIDFLVPGLLGMNIMGSGLWGVGFVTVDMRVRKLLKRLVATPMNRSYFLWSMIGGRMMFALPELLVILLAGVWLFGVPVRGNLVGIFVLVLAGAMCFAGIGLLVASRAERTETVSGLMNLVMLPMWMLSGIFFSTKNFPDVLQPFIQALPLTQLNNGLRAMILDGRALHTQWLPLVALLGIGGLCFGLALRWFKWS